MISSTSRYSMGNDAADLKGDRRLEIFTTDLLPEDPEIWMKSLGEDKAKFYQIKEQFGYQDQYVRNHLQPNQGEAGFIEIALFSEEKKWSQCLSTSRGFQSGSFHDIGVWSGQNEFS